MSITRVGRRKTDMRFIHLPVLTMSWMDIRPVEYTMVLGGVAIGSINEVFTERTAGRQTLRGVRFASTAAGISTGTMIAAVAELDAISGRAQEAGEAQ